MQVLLAYLWSEHMESLPFELPLFLLATFLLIPDDGRLFIYFQF